MQQLSGLDAMFVHAEMHGLPMHISSFSIYDRSTAPGGKVEFRQIVDLFENLVHKNVPILRKKLVEVPFNLDQPYWDIDPNFDTVYHIRHIALPKPANWQKLYTLIANLHSLPLNRNRPLWEVYVIDGLDHLEGFPKGCFGLLLKVHHSIMDGRTGMHIFNSLHATSPTGKPELVTTSEGDQSSSMDEKHTTSRMLRFALLNNVRKTGHLVYMLGKTASLFTQVNLGLKSRTLKSLAKPKTRFNAPISPRRIVDCARFPLDDIRLICNAVKDETVNDVAMTIIGGALRKYLLAKDELPEDSLVASVPVDIRTEEDRDHLGNMLNIMNVAVRSDIDDPLERLRAVHQESVASKAYAATLGKNIVVEVLDNLYSGLTAWGIHTAFESGILDKLPPVNNTIVTNIPGAPVPMYMLGAQMIDSFGMGPLIPNTGLFHVVMSNCDKLAISFTACRRMMDDPGFYEQCLEESFTELLLAAKQAKVAGKHRQKNARGHHAAKSTAAVQDDASTVSTLKLVGDKRK